LPYKYYHMKPITHNDYTQCINKVVAYINNHLEESLDLKTLAKVAIYIKEKQLKTL